MLNRLLASGRSGFARIELSEKIHRSRPKYPAIRNQEICKRAHDDCYGRCGQNRSFQSFDQTINHDRIAGQRDKAVARMKPPQSQGQMPGAFSTSIAPLETGIPNPAAVMSILVATAAVLIPVRLFIIVAVTLDSQNLPSKFSKLFPVLLILDLLWAVSPFLLIHHINAGLALGLSAPLVYLPFAQRSLILMYARGA